MIHRDRAAVAPPSAFSKRADEAMLRLVEFAERKRADRSQLRFPFDDRIPRLAKPPLLALFEGKCAYCESPIGRASPGDVELFRPRQEAMDLDGRVRDPDLYWWLAYDWDNQLYACSRCNSAKATRFPVKHRRAEPRARGEALESEGRLLLDPCHDDAEAELGFSSDGLVTGLTERGAISIECLALNRGDLVSARRNIAEKLLGQLATMSHEQIENSMASLAPTSGAYTALRRQIVREHLPHSRNGVHRTAVEPTIRGSVWLERVAIRNFRCIPSLELTFPPVSGERQPWVILLGINGVGKSSVLQAVALALMSSRDLRRYLPDASELVNRRSVGDPTGDVVLSFSDRSQVTLRFNSRDATCERDGRPPAMNIYGYGSTRLPPRAGDRAIAKPSATRLHNLFDPRYPLSLAEQWMASPRNVSSQRFAFFANALRSLLDFDNDEDRLTRRAGHLYIQQNQLRLPLSGYSDGYRSVVAFCTDLMLNLSGRWDSMSAAEGLVLIDELEVHLHPTWRLTIVDRLRDVFPRVRFLATTHDPLCLRGMAPGEIHVLDKDDETYQVRAVQRDIPAGLTADELLTGLWFGLATTLDPDTTRLLAEHSRLLLSKQTKAIRTQREQLEIELRQRRGSFVETDQESMVRSMLAEIRAGQPALTPEQKRDARRAVLDRVT